MGKDFVKQVYAHWKKLLAGEINFIKNWRRRIRKISGTKIGGIKASKTNIKRYGKNFYGEIGAIGGRAGTTGGFYADRKLARTAGAIGGSHSRRGWKLVTIYEGWLFYKQKNGKKIIAVSEDDKELEYDLRNYRTLNRLFSKALRIKLKEKK